MAWHQRPQLLDDFDAEDVQPRLQNLRGQVAKPVAAGILPAVEPGCPARRRKRSHTPTVLENFRTALIIPSFFPGGGTPAFHGRRDVCRHNAFAAFSSFTANGANGRPHFTKQSGLRFRPEGCFRKVFSIFVESFGTGNFL